MKTPELHGYLPTPWGVEIEVHRRTDRPEEADDAILFSMDASAIMAGIHGTENRKGAVAAIEAGARATGAVDLGIFTRFGGFVPIPRKPLPVVHRDDSVFASMPDGYDVHAVRDAWVTELADRHRWCDRAVFLRRAMVENFERPDMAALPVLIRAFPIHLLLTSALENLGEKEVDCLEAAAFYALSAHAAWRKVGAAWLEPVRATWWADWIGARQDLARVVAAIQRMERSIPAWLVGARA